MTSDKVSRLYANISKDLETRNLLPHMSSRLSGNLESSQTTLSRLNDLEYELNVTLSSVRLLKESLKNSRLVNPVWLSPILTEMLLLSALLHWTMNGYDGHPLEIAGIEWSISDPYPKS
jgi:hypothetical protein